MTKLLTFCIPTYKRPDTLRRCIDSIVLQIEKYDLSNCVDIYVTNDASPDDTVTVLCAYESLSYFSGVTREKNLGMSVNIKCMLTEVAKKSDYQLIITDDDYLQADVLSEIVEFLRGQQDAGNSVPAIWTPRYSYTEDGTLRRVDCKPFKDSRQVRPSAVSAGKYMNNGFVLSGLILRADCIDYAFWEQYRDNAYFPMILFGDLLFRSGGYYWNNNIVHHTVLNECHWEMWGENDVVIALRLFTDWMNSYGVMAKKVHKNYKAASFYFSSISGIRYRMRDVLYSRLMVDKHMTLDAIYKLKARGVLKFNFPLRLLMICALPRIAINALVSIIRLKLAMLVRGKQKEQQRRKACDEKFMTLRFMPVMLKIILP